MRTQIIKVALCATISILFPIISNAQGVADEIHSLQSVLDQLYAEMLPLCSQLIDVGRGIAGFAALWYISSRVWRSIVNAEPIDFYPLLRPFGLGLAILLFPYVIAVMNGVLKPTVTGTAAMMKNSNDAIAYLLKRKEAAIKESTQYYLYGDEATHGRTYRYLYPDAEEETGTDLVSSGIKFLMAQAAYGMKNQIKQWLAEILQILYEAAALCINTIRTFYLIVLAILGPLVFGLSVFDGLQNTLTVWIARYINVFLWLPVANIFGSIISRIQVNMLRHDIAQIEMYGDTSFDATDSGRIIFLIIAIVGYFTVPSVANYIVHAGGGSILLQKASNVFIGTTQSAYSSTKAGTAAIAKYLAGSSSSGSQSSGQSGKGSNQSDDYQRNKLSGNK